MFNRKSSYALNKKDPNAIVYMDANEVPASSYSRSGVALNPRRYRYGESLPERFSTNEKHRIDEIDRLITKLYEDNFAGKLSDERYSRMAAKYEKEQAELLQSVSTKEKELAELERKSVDIRLLLAGLREYSGMETLTPEVVNKIIKRIEVHNSEMVNGHKQVCIDIHFTGVGLVDLATIKEMLAIAEAAQK